MEKERAQMIDAEKKHEEDWKALIDKANDQATSAEARDRNKRAASEKYSELENDKQSITTFDRVARQRLEEKQRQRRDDIVKEIWAWSPPTPNPAATRWCWIFRRKRQYGAGRSLFQRPERPDRRDD